MIWILSLLSCSKERTYTPPTFPVEKSLQSIRISKEEMMLIYPYDICADNEYIYVLSLVNSTWIQVYDKLTGEYIGGYIRKGQGPGEISTGISLSLDEEHGIISIFDQSTLKLSSYKVDKTSDNIFFLVEEKNFHLESGVVRKAWNISANTYLIDGQLSEGSEQQRFQILSDGNVTAEYNIIPGSSIEERMICLSSLTTVSPNRQKMAVGTLYGAYLEIFNLSKNIEQTTIRQFYPPIAQYESGVLKGTSGTIYGFSSLYATDNYIYSVLIGDKDINKFDNISVFDWKGKEVIRYKTDCLVFKLFVSPKQSDKIYAIAFSPEEGFYLVYFEPDKAI